MRETIKCGISNSIASEIINLLNYSEGEEPKEIPDEQKTSIRETIEKSINDIDKINNLTEYVRAVHGEMEAIMSCARKGISTLNAHLYCTTYPCHNCAKHIISAGIKRVTFIEPYPKSLTTLLHGDAISHSSANSSQGVILEQFNGVGPRRFLDFFSQNLSSGISKSRKGTEETPWEISIFSPTVDTARFSVNLESVISCEHDAAKWFVDNSVIKNDSEYKNQMEEKLLQNEQVTTEESNRIIQEASKKEMESEDEAGT